ncbi:MAG: Xaa-Pro peptidase family protein [Saccharofermentans sp.]|nr:Xaa-Pro peptidase family protein [Saccharofermentans sp.]
MVSSSSFYSDNRKDLLGRLDGNTSAVFYSGEVKAMNADTDYRFLPDRNFFYLTGLTRPGFVLVISADKTTLYAPCKDAYKERWHGKRLTFEQISDISGIDTCDIKDIDTYEEDLLCLAKDKEAKVALDGESIMQGPRKYKEVLSGYGKQPIDIRDIMSELRLIKKPYELDQIRKACKATEEALEEMSKLIRPGVTEYELATKLEYEMARRTSQIFAFETIVSCNTNTFYLHHADPESEGEGVAREGGIIQIDCGARVAGYCADISRVYFVGEPCEGDKRMLLLDLIRELRREAFAFIAPGRTFDELNSQMYDICSRWLDKNGLISDNLQNNVRDYYWHNTSHYLGLDVHDTGDRKRKFTSGVCLAVEPGVYIPSWGIGFRIEDDVVVTGSGCELLSSGRDDPEGIIAR